jgi:DNA-binding CsgD family transcriptional regulator
MRPSSSTSTYRYTHALRGARAPYNPRALNLGLELLCHACPFGAMLLDSDHRVVFTNREGCDLLSRWTSPRGQLVKSAAGSVPREIIAACEELRRGKSNRATPKGRPSFGGRVFVRHPANQDLSAVVALERSPRDRRLALFCIFLHDRLRQNLASGRRDQLTMLTVAERRVAKLAVEGLRNREIAASLGKSLTTVKSQLATIFGKLQVSSRMQLATLLRPA